MSTSAHYANAPIVEAIIDIRVALNDGFDPQVLRIAGNPAVSEYVDVEELVQAFGTMEATIGKEGKATFEKSTHGFKFSTPDSKQIAQMRRDGFSFSRLTPYDNWEVFKTDASRLWRAYRDVANPAMITRLAVRYINRIDVPETRVDLKNYFRVFPEFPTELPAIGGFFMQVRIPFQEISAASIVNQMIVPPVRENVTSFVLDIDLFRESDIPQPDDDIWAYFEELHEYKNRVFESCITDSSRELFK